MKKVIISAIAGAICMFLIILLMAKTYEPKEAKTTEYSHDDFVSQIRQEDCHLCGEDADPIISYRMDEDNVGILNLNTFDLLYVEINRYSDNRQLIESTAGYMQTSGMPGDNNTAYAFTFPDNGYAQVHIKDVEYSINRNNIQKSLCQNCLDAINTLHYSDHAPSEYAVISFSDHTIRPLMKNTSWFAAGNFGVDCEFKENGEIYLLIHYSPVRYQ